MGLATLFIAPALQTILFSDTLKWKKSEQSGGATLMLLLPGGVIVYKVGVIM
jgi:hypothetical protein